MVTRQESAYGLRRMGFGGTVAEIDALAPKKRSNFVTAGMVARDQTPVQPAFLTDAALSDWQKIESLMTWWFDRMVSSSYTDVSKPSPLVEKMTLFWHNHFATSGDKVFYPKFLYDQNALFRRLAIGNFRTLCKEMSVQPAMLMYLDNESNTKSAPNQNFARELMELFMLGVGNYTEDDVLTAAAAWTGHNIEWTQDANGNWYPKGYKFYADRHDTVSRTLLGKTQVWDGPAMIDWILDNPSTRMIAAKFIVKKLWTWFAYSNPAQTIVDALATTFANGNWAIKPVLTAMFNRAEFWTATAQNGAIRGPFEFMAAAGKATGMKSNEIHPEWFGWGMGQQVFYPPNVSGWRPNEYWINTSSTTVRADFANYLVWKLLGDGGFNVNFLKDVVDDTLPANQRPAAATVVTKALEKFSIVAPTSDTTTNLTTWCTTNRHQWTNAEPWSYWGERVHLIQQILMCPDFQLN